MSLLGLAVFAALFVPAGAPAVDASQAAQLRIGERYRAQAADGARYVAPTHAIREQKDAMTREVLERFRAAGVRVASATLELVGR